VDACECVGCDGVVRGCCAYSLNQRGDDKTGTGDVVRV
jgi:hypothetical protein